MSDEMVVDGVQYISSKRAAALSGYAQDYIGQLARGGNIQAQRVGGLWFVNLESLQSYKKGDSHEASARENLTPGNPTDPDTFVGLDGISYISANRASKISGYNQDYVGQLARSGQIVSRQVGTRWYIDADSLIAHKQQKDALLAAVQSESVGIHRTPPEPMNQMDLGNKPESQSFMRYFSDEGDLMPQTAGLMSHEAAQEEQVNVGQVSENGADTAEDSAQRLPIRLGGPQRASDFELDLNRERRNRAIPMVRPSTFPIVRAVLFSVVAITGIGVVVAMFISGRTVVANSSGSVRGVAAVAEAGVSAIERILTREIVYSRPD